jgi:hypothetical protein
MTQWVESKVSADILDLQWRAQNYSFQLGAIPDPAAKILLERLGFAIEKHFIFNERNRLQAMQSCWIDKTCLNFLQQYPDALIIELGSGFSSRFHRLSSALDWPRFRWLILDEEKVIEKTRTILPRIDNFELICWKEAGSLLNYWQGEPMMVLFEQKTIKMSISEMTILCHNLQYHSKKWTDNCQLELQLFDERFVKKSWLQKIKNWCLTGQSVACVKLATEF